MRQIGAVNFASGQLLLDVPKGIYKAFVFGFSGTNNTSATIAITELGRLRIIRDNEDYCNLDFSDLSNFNNADGGYPKFASTTSGAFAAQMHYDFFNQFDKSNVLNVGENNVQIQVNLSATGMGKVTTSGATLIIYGILSNGIEKYNRRIFDFSQNLGDVGSVISPLLTQSNVNRLYLKTASDFGTVQVLKDNELLINASSDALLFDTDYQNFIESAVTFIFVNLNPTGNIAEIVSKQLQLYLTSAKSGGGVTTILFEQIKFSPKDTNVSKTIHNAWRRQKYLDDIKAREVQTILALPPVSNPNAGVVHSTSNQNSAL